MILLRNFLWLSGVFAFTAALIGADTEANVGDTLTLPAEQIDLALRQTAMPGADVLGDGRLARTLSRYYNQGLGGPDQWDRIYSLKVSGTLKRKHGDFDLINFQKKPDSFKVVIRKNSVHRIFGYDGETAWQSTSRDASQSRLMDEKEARQFKHVANFFDYLLYPYASGKKTEYIDVVPVEGKLCHQIRVTLDTDFQIDYFIDINALLKVEAITTDLQEGTIRRVVYKDYTREPGMPVAREIDSYRNGEWVSTSIFDEIEVNAGIFPWVFEVPR